ncbi:MAG: YybH family protein [Candidatus Thorarchaeota archaeon]|jgi:ketosteroid isomerase-like protein
MTSNANPEVKSRGGSGDESISNHSKRESLLKAIAELHLAFSEHRALDMSNLFSEEAILMFPGTPDIVNRESIREAFVDFMKMYTTISFEMDQEFIDIGEYRATYLAKFIEIRTPKEGGPTEKVYGRMLEIWELSSEKRWEVIRLMTGRYSETELLE